MRCDRDCCLIPRPASAPVSDDLFKSRIASLEMFSDSDALPHLICSPAIFDRRSVMRRISMATRDELILAIADRYREAERAQKARILDEFVVITGYHRKHAMRLLRSGRLNRRSTGKEDL
jgi:hypothetical protein